MHSIGIVGGSGYIGRALARHLSRGFQVKTLDVREPKNNEGIEHVNCDIRSISEVERGLRDVELVIHAAIVQIPQINEQKRLGYEVNVLGTQNVCEVVDRAPGIRAMILASSWHTIGERQFEGIIDEEFGFRPDKVEDRARLYAISKMAQESIIRFYNEMSTKVYGAIKMGTVLGEGMPEKTAASLFLQKGLKGEPITPFKHSMYRPMLYVDIRDVCNAYEKFAEKILNGELRKQTNGLAYTIGVYYPKPITILELAEIVRDAVRKYSTRSTKSTIEIVDSGKQAVFVEKDREKLKVDISKAVNLLGLRRFTEPRESIDRIVREILRVET